MDLDEMKAVWSDLGDQLEKQKQLTQEVILKMTQEKSSSRLGRIIWMESIGITISVIFQVYLALNFHRLNDWLSITGGIVMTMIILTGIVFGSAIIRKARKINVIENTYSEVIRQFDEFRAMLRTYKKLGIWTNIIGPFMIIPVVYTLILDKNILDDLPGLGAGILATAIVVPVILYLIIKFYSRNVSAVKKALNDIDFKD